MDPNTNSTENSGTEPPLVDIVQNVDPEKRPIDPADIYIYIYIFT